ncbi:16S rRNA (cytidine(1402)-2'-O)-methyltransferase [Candidatus Nomurabacteria bacterium]|nr:16S rRNA (cytidine(1402)-2'-O)-methyltransferase [Candidatus Nomurabacteria bacterium]
MEPGTLYLVATPIGNLEDITYRAVRILREADYVLCEDTRVTGRLLERYEIEAKLRRYDAHASEQVHSQILEDLLAGKHIALVSDAGTPGVSDPGVLLVQGAREARARVEVIPGSSAVTAAVSLAGIAGNQFTFLGFVPQKKGRQTFFERLPTIEAQPVVFFESTHRIMKTLEALSAAVPTAQVYLARELTKLHETMHIGTAAELHSELEADPVTQKGEFVVLVNCQT